MAAISRRESQCLLWGWERFFEELLTFMQGCRQTSEYCKTRPIPSMSWNVCRSQLGEVF